MQQAAYLLNRFKIRWQLLRGLEPLIYALGPAIFVFTITYSMLWSLIIFALLALFIFFLIKPWAINLPKVVSYLDKNLDALQYSSGLLLTPATDLSGIARIQQQKIIDEIQIKLRAVKKEHHLARASMVLAFFIALSSVFYILGITQSTKALEVSAPSRAITFQPLDSATAKIKPPLLDSIRVIVSYPAYTGKRPFLAPAPAIKALEGSRVSWRLHFNHPIDAAQLEIFGKIQDIIFSKATYHTSAVIDRSGFYTIKFKDSSGNGYSSPLFPITTFADQPPLLEVKGLDPFVEFNFDDQKKLPFTVNISDDFGVADAYIMATVSKGSGENVKFREERLPFEQSVKKGSATVELTKTIDLDLLKMEPGDELYFYIETLDLKEPRPNVTRSETFFAVIKDTINMDFATSGGMGLDLMPDYFRSQRQLIIDTEKLIKDQSHLSKKEFDNTSNQLGAEQKALRLKYGQFMGDEAESGINVQESMPDGEDAVNPSDALKGYRHDHDKGTEHEDAGITSVNEQEDGVEKDALGAYLHNHNEPEEATLFTLSLKSKLRKALNEMWDAELHLRLNTPKQSLPYQHRALDLLQDIKNSARIYVHRMGFDPPPIKEDKRMTGKLDEVRPYSKATEAETKENYPNIEESVATLEKLIVENKTPSAQDRDLFKKAGEELAALAITRPGNYLQALQQLKTLSENTKPQAELLQSLRYRLIDFLPKVELKPGDETNVINGLNTALLKELESDE